MPCHGGEDAVVPGLSSASPATESGGVGPRPNDCPSPESVQRPYLGSPAASPPPRGSSGPGPGRGPPDPGDGAGISPLCRIWTLLSRLGASGAGPGCGGLGTD